MAVAIATLPSSYCGMAEDDHSWSPLEFAEEQAVHRGATQNVRALSEGWAAAPLSCRACGAERLRQLPNNSPFATSSATPRR